jgi:hypothetical protein
MARENLIVNGYKVPGGWGGIGVRRACEIIIKRPGIRQIDLFNELVLYTRLHAGTSKWMVTPNSGPAMRLWSRQKVGRGFCCYPNEFTHLVTGAEKLGKELWLHDQRRNCELHLKFEPKVGELICFEDRTSIKLVHFSGWTFYSGLPTKRVFQTIEEMADFAAPIWSVACGACSDAGGFYAALPNQMGKITD